MDVEKGILKLLRRSPYPILSHCIPYHSIPRSPATPLPSTHPAKEVSTYMPRCTDAHMPTYLHPRTPTHKRSKSRARSQKIDTQQGERGQQRAANACIPRSARVPAQNSLSNSQSSSPCNLRKRSATDTRPRCCGESTRGEESDILS